MDTRTTGFPSPAADYIEGRISIDNEVIKHPSATFFFTVEGDSMEGAHIPNGCKLVVDRSVKPSSGSIVVAVVEGEYIIRRLEIKGTTRLLMPENKKYKPIPITQDTQIWGTVVYILIDAKGV